jgi:sugar lactone lactonase YvrE
MRESLVRRLLASCVVAVGIFAAFAGTQSAQTASGSGANQAESTSSDPLVNPTVIANGVLARALAVEGTAKGTSKLYVTNAFMPNQLFLLGATAVAGIVPKPFLIPVAGDGQAGSLGDGGVAISAQLDLSSDSLFMRSGIAVASDGTIFIADTKNGTIRSIAGQASTEPSVIRSVAGKWASRQNVLLTEPMGIALDRARDLYIADHGAGSVDVLVAATGKLETLGHVIAPGSIAVTADGSKVFVASPEAGAVFSISTESGAVTMVAGAAAAKSPSATNAAANACTNLETSTGTAMTVAPTVKTASAGNSSTQQMCPAGLAVDGKGNLFIADANGGKILRLDANTNKVTVVASDLSAPGEITLDSKGTLYVSEQGRSRVISMGVANASNLILTAPAPPIGCAQGLAFTFCDEPVGGQTATAAFTLTNTSPTTPATAVTIGFVPPTAPGNFTVIGTSCTSTLAAGASCTLSVAFTPQMTGLTGAVLSVTDAAADLATLAMAGTGNDYDIQLASGQTNELTVVQGGTATYKAVVLASGTFGDKGEQVTFLCPTNLPTFSTCAFNPCPVTATPNAATPFTIVIVTSSPTTSAPTVVPCPGPVSSVRRVAAQNPTIIFYAAPAAGAGNGNLIFRRFPALALLLICCVGFGGTIFFPRRSATHHRLETVHVPLIIAIAGLTAAIAIGCGGSKGTLPSIATPVGVTNLKVLGNATDADGNPLGASRSMDFTIDVVKAF